MLAVLQPISEAVGADDRVGVEHDAVSQNRIVVKNDMGVQDHVVSQPAVPANDSSAVDSAALAQDRVFSDHRKWPKFTAFAQPGRGMHAGQRVEPMCCICGAALEVADN